MTARRSTQKDGSDSYVVSAPLIQVVVGSQLLQYSFGDVLPNGLSEKSLTHLAENGLIRKGEVVSGPAASDDE